MLPPLNLPVGTTGAACADDSIEVQRFNPPDTHEVTWVCPADNKKCTAAYEFDWRRSRNDTLTLCVSPKPRLLSLVYDHTTITDYLTEYEREVLQTDAIKKEVVAACQRMGAHKADQTFSSTLLKCKLSASSAEAYNAAAPEEVVVKERKLYVEIGGERVELVELVDTDLLLGQWRKMKGVPDPNESAPSVSSQFTSIEIKADEEPRVAFKLVEKELYIQLTNHSGSVCLHGSITFRATNQLSLKKASEDARVLDIMTRFTDYDPSTTVVRDDDYFGQDVAVITFMLWLAAKTDYGGYTHKGCLNLAKDSGGDPQMLAPEIFLMGTHAKQVTHAWINKYGDFKDTHKLPYEPMPPPPSIQTISEYTRRGREEPSPLLEDLFPNGNPHVIALARARRILKAAFKEQQAA